MSFDHFLHWLDATQFSAVMRESIWAEPIVETIHVLTLTLFLGFVLLLDLRLLDVVLRRKRVSQMFEQFNPWLFRGFALMLVTGLLLFSADPVNFYSTLFFKLKMIMLVLAGVNVAFYHATIGKHIAEWDVAAATPWKVKLCGVVSLVLWVGIVACGRGIAYALPPP